MGIVGRGLVVLVIAAVSSDAAAQTPSREPSAVLPCQRSTFS